MTKDTNATGGAAIKRYKIGYHTDEWGMRDSTPSGIPDHAGAWVRYEDHVAALVEAQQPATHVPNPAEIEHVAGDVSKNGAESNMSTQPAAQPAVQQGDATRAAARALSDRVAEMCNVDKEDHWKYHSDDVLYDAELVVSTYLAARAHADSVTAAAGGVDDDVDAIALARYKVVPAHESMFHRFAVVAGDGKQQLYLGREVECENMARKFAGAFLDGAFYQSNIAPTPPAPAADSVLEDAARWQALPAFFEEYQIDAMKLYRDIDAYLAAARKQGGV